MFKLSDYFIKQEEAPVDGGQGGGGKTYTQEEFDAAVAGLKASQEKLLAETKESKRKAAEDAEARRLADIEAQKKAGDLVGLENNLRTEFGTQIEAKDKIIAARNERILTSEKRAVVGSLSGMLIDESASEILSLLVRTEFDGDDVVTKFVGADGNVITTDVEQFKKYLCEHKAYSHLIKADAATGGGAYGGKFRGGATNFASMTLTEKSKLANENPALYAQLSGKK